MMPAPSRRDGGRHPGAFVVFIAGTLLAGLAGCSGGQDPADSASGPDQVEASPTDVLVEESATVGVVDESASSVLIGDWQRPDGGYVIRIKGVRPEGSLDAAYFNPNPIHVGTAVWRQVGQVLKLEVVLDDVNYQGSNYTLVYNRETDQLEGVYYQAVAQQNFDVFFVRRTPFEDS